jgi:hypothetical protein
VGAAVAVVLAACGLAGCGGGHPSAAGGGHPQASATASPSSSGDRAGASHTPSSAPYADTTCAQWATELSGQQRTVAARTLLAGERHGDGATGTPGNRLVAKFERDLTQACRGDAKASVADTAAAVYQIAHKDFAPAK